MKKPKTKFKSRLVKEKTKKGPKPFTAVQEKRYRERQQTVHEMGCLTRQIEKLKEQRNKLDARLAPAFEQYGNKRKLSDGTIVERTVIDVDERVATEVGQVISSSYSYPKYTEVAGNP